MIRSRKLLKMVSDRRHLCLTPTVVLNHSSMLPFIWTALVALISITGIAAAAEGNRRRMPQAGVERSSNVSHMLKSIIDL